MNNQLPHCQQCPFFVKAIQSCPTQSLNPFQSSLHTIIWQFLLQIGSFTPYFIVFGLIAYTVISKDKSKINLLVCLFFQIFINFQNFISVTIKAVVQQPRPDGACSDSFGFPSSHASFATSLWFYMLLQNRRKNQLLSFRTLLYTIYLVLVIVSRYVLNYHSPFQLVFGLALGIASTLAMKRYGTNLFNLLTRESIQISDQDSQYNNQKLYKDVSELQNKMNHLQDLSQKIREVTYTSQQRIIKLNESNLKNGNDKMD